MAVNLRIFPRRKSSFIFFNRSLLKGRDVISMSMMLILTPDTSCLLKQAGISDTKNMAYPELWFKYGFNLYHLNRGQINHCFYAASLFYGSDDFIAPPLGGANQGKPEVEIGRASCR